MNFDNSFIEKIKDENDIVDVVSEYVSLKGTHGNFHKEILDPKYHFGRGEHYVG